MRLLMFPSLRRSLRGLSLRPGGATPEPTKNNTKTPVGEGGED